MYTPAACVFIVCESGMLPALSQVAEPVPGTAGDDDHGLMPGHHTYQPPGRILSQAACGEFMRSLTMNWVVGGNGQPAACR